MTDVNLTRILVYIDWVRRWLVSMTVGYEGRSYDSLIQAVTAVRSAFLPQDKAEESVDRGRRLEHRVADSGKVR